MSPMITCGTNQPSDCSKHKMGKAYVRWKNEKDDGSRALGRARKVHYKVPTYFHIIQKNATLGHISKRHVKEVFMKLLNRGYRKTAFSFVLKGVDYNHR